MDNGVQGHRIPASSAAVLCSRYSQDIAEIYSSSLTFFRLSLWAFLAAFIAALKALISYNGIGLFAIFIHPIKFYSSPFCLDMFTQFLIINLNNSLYPLKGNVTEWKRSNNASAFDVLALNIDLHFIIPLQNTRYNNKLYCKCRFYTIFCLGYVY